MPGEICIYTETDAADLAPITKELITKGRELAEQLGS